MTLAIVVFIGIITAILAIILPQQKSTHTPKRLEAKRLEALQISRQKAGTPKSAAESVPSAAQNTPKTLEEKRLEAKRLEAKRLEAKRLEALQISRQKAGTPRSATESVPSATQNTPKTLEEKRLEAKRLEAKRIEALRKLENIPEPTPTEEELLKEEIPAEVFYKERPLLTPTETNFAQHLLQILPNGYSISCKPGLWALLTPDKERCNYWTAWNKIKEKHIDFIIIRNADFKVVLALELDDPSHYKNPKKQTMESDNFKKNHLVSVGIPFLRIPATKKTDQYNLLQLEALILPYLN